MEESQPQPGPSDWSPQRLTSVGPGDELGYARYVHQPGVEGLRARKEVVRFRCARNHYLRLAWLIEMAWTSLEQYRQDIHKLAGRVEKEHFTHSDTTLRLGGYNSSLRSQTVEMAKSVYMMAERVKGAQVEIGWMLDCSDVDEASDTDYEHAEEVVVTLPTQSGPHKLIRDVRRAMAWIRRGDFPRKTRISDTSISLLLNDKFNTSDTDLKKVVKGMKRQSAKDTSGFNTKSNEVATDVDRSRNIVANGDGREDSVVKDTGDQRVKAPSSVRVMRYLWQQHRALRDTLVTLARTLHENEKGRKQMPTEDLGRAATRLLVVDMMNSVVAVEAALRQAMLEVAIQAQRLDRFGAETWPGEPATRCGPFRDPQPPPSSLRRMCSFFCCLRGC